MRADDDLEMTYIRAVEDCFAELRKHPHMLSQKEIHLAKKWWKEEIPLEAVRSGILEIIARRQAEGEDSVFGLAYCRHAVKRQAKLLAQMRTGLQENWTPEDSALSEDLLLLSRKLDERAACLKDVFHEVSELILKSAQAIASQASIATAEIDLELFHMETALLAACFEALPAEERHEILRMAEEKAKASGARDEVLERTRRVFQDKLVRELLELPRFE